MYQHADVPVMSFQQCRIMISAYDVSYDADIMIRHCGKDITGTSACWYIVHLVAHLITHTTSHTHRTLRVPAGSERAGWGNDGLQILRGGRMGNARTCRLVGIDDSQNAGLIRGMQSCRV